MTKEIYLTGITTSGIPHLGNYVGAIKPATLRSKNENIESFYFLADYHSLVKKQDAKLTEESTKQIAATWLACGLDPEKTFFYRQSDIPEIPELAWILTCLTSKGLMNRAHAYKAAISENHKKKDPDAKINMGLYCYPILMAADILIFNADKIPVGQDQIQHIEMTRDLANKFNSNYTNLFSLPEAFISTDAAVLKGLDGRKMSKSYNNTIPLFIEEGRLKKLIMKIKTDSKGAEEEKDTKDCAIFEIYKAFASRQETENMKKKYKEGISWKDAKNELFNLLDYNLKDFRDRYNELIKNFDYVEEILKKGSEKARQRSSLFLKKIKEAAGIKSIF